jgi:two-component system response regulator RegX3
MITILVVEPDHEVADMVVQILRSEGIDASVASDSDGALQEIDRNPPDAIVLTLGPGGAWGEELCREMRQRSIAPVLVVGTRRQQVPLARTLNAGADAHLLRPFTEQMFLSQVYALLRRVGLARPGHAGQFDIGTLAINVFRREVRVHGSPVELTPTEFEILRCLLNNAGRALTYRSLVRQVLGYDCTSAQARDLLKVHIHNLRKKIEPAPDMPAHLLNVRGFGYLFERRRFDRANPRGVA